MNLRCFVISWFGCVSDFSASHLTYLTQQSPVVSIWKILGPSLASMSMETWALRENSIHYRIYSHISRSTYKSTPWLCGWKNDQNAWPMYKSTPQYQVMMASFSSAHSYSTVVLYDLEFDREPLCTDFMDERMLRRLQYITSAFKIVCR